MWINQIIDYREVIKLQILLNFYILYFRSLFMTSESEPVSEPTNHKCEDCGRVFSTAEELTIHYKRDHSDVL